MKGVLLVFAVATTLAYCQETTPIPDVPTTQDVFQCFTEVDQEQPECAAMLNNTSSVS